MNRDFSFAPSRAADNQADRHSGKRIEAGSISHAPSALLNVLAQNHGDPSAGLA
ncbi:MAG TPA: hypothetical protein VKH63_02205 [Candidatus Acidoferrum sp.]|nr:hypothetical protein [Candidatus Acidoferrum sp.]